MDYNDGRAFREVRKRTIKSLLDANGKRIVTQTVKDYGLGLGHGIRVYYILWEPESMELPELRNLTGLLQPILAEGIFDYDETNGCFKVPPHPIWNPGIVVGTALSSLLYGMGLQGPSLRIDELTL